MRISDWSSDVCSSDVPWYPAVDFGGRRVHRAVRGRGAQRGGHAVLHQGSARAWQSLGGCDSRGSADETSTRYDDRARRVAGLRADGAQRRRGFGGAAPARNGGDRRDHLIYHFDPARTAGALPAGPWAQREDGRRGTRITTTGTEPRSEEHTTELQSL